MNFLTSWSSNHTEITETQIIYMFYKLLVTFSEMEAHNIYHGDIKPHNMIVDKYWNIKIIDFSISAIKNESMTLATMHRENPLQGTPGYTAPEITEMINQHRQTGEFLYSKSDVFSLGLVFLQMITLKNYDGYNIASRNYELLGIAAGLKYEWARSLLYSMLQLDPANRPSFSSCLKNLTVIYTQTVTNQQHKV